MKKDSKKVKKPASRYEKKFKVGLSFEELVKLSVSPQKLKAAKS